MEFDARAVQATLQPPVLIDLAGVRHEGQILSADAYAAFFSAHEAAVEQFLSDQGLPAADAVAFGAELCAAAQFPDAAAESLRRLPGPVLREALLYLLGCLGGRPKTTNGATPVPEPSAAASSSA